MGKINKKLKNEVKLVNSETKTSKSVSAKILKPKSLKTKRNTVTSSLSVHKEEILTLDDIKEDSISSNEDEFTTNTFSIAENSVKSGIQAVFKLIETYKSKKKNELFDDEVPIFLQVSCIRVPNCPVRTMHLKLRNSLYKSTSEICLITANLRNNPRKEHDKTIEHYENLLKTNGVENIKTIMPLHQLKTEYDQYELKRKLLTQHDAFLAEGKICKNASHLLGNIFKNKRKQPLAVKLYVPKLKQHVENVLNKTAMNIHPNGDNFIVEVAHTEMPERKIQENIFSLLEELAKNFPGGKENVRAIHLKGPNTESIPIYYSLKKACDVPIPIVRSRRPKKFKPVSGTLSTFLDRTVLVDPSGIVVVSKKASNFEDEGEDADVNGEEKFAQQNEDTAGKFVRLYQKSDLDRKKENRKQSKQRSGKAIKKNRSNNNKGKINSSRKIIKRRNRN